MHEHCKSRGPRFEEIEEKLPSNCSFSTNFHFHPVVKPRQQHVSGKLPAVASPPLGVHRDSIPDGWKRCLALKCVGVILRPAQKEGEGRARRENTSSVHYTFFTRHANVVRGRNLRTAGSHPPDAHSVCVYEDWIPCVVLRRVGTIPPLPAPLTREREKGVSIVFGTVSFTRHRYTPTLEHPTTSPPHLQPLHGWRHIVQRSGEGGWETRGRKQVDVHFGGKSFILVIYFSFPFSTVVGGFRTCC